MTCRHSHTPQVQVTLGALCWTVILHLWHARRHKTSHKERKEKKKPRWHRRLIPPLSPKKTHKRKLGAFFSPREHTTSKCQRAEPLLGLMWNDVPAAMHHPPGEGGSRGPPPAARSICVRGAAEFWPLRPVEEMDLLQAPLPAPTNYQSDTHTHTHTEASVTTRILWGTMCSRTLSHLYFHTLFQGGFTETDLQQDVKSSHPDPFQFMMQVLTHKRGSQVNKKWHKVVLRMMCDVNHHLFSAAPVPCRLPERADRRARLQSSCPTDTSALQQVPVETSLLHLLSLPCPVIYTHI